VQALDLPAGDRDLPDQVHGLLVNGRVDLGELVDQVEVGLTLLVAEDGGVRRDEGRQFVREIAGFDAVSGRLGFPRVASRTLALRSVFPRYFGSLFFGQTLLLFLGLETEKAPRVKGGPLLGRISHPQLQTIRSCQDFRLLFGE
jgi:hypothetical protein